MGNMLGSAAVTRSYVDFEPSCELKKEEGCETLVLHIPDFKKSQLKVQINNLGVLTISGERPIDEIKWSRFCKQINVSKDCEANEIKAKLSGAYLYVKMPMKSTTVARQDEPEPKPDTNQEKVTGKFTVNESSSAGEKSTASAGEKSTATESASRGYKFGLQGLKMDKKMAVNVSVAVTFVVVVGLGAYAAYRYQSSHAQI